MACDIHQELLDRRLLRAVTGGSESRVLRLLRLGANPNVRNNDGAPLTLLMRDCDVWVRNRIVDLLLAAGADESPLKAAAKVCRSYEWPSSRYIRHLGAGIAAVDRTADLDLARHLLTRVTRRG